MADDPVLNKVLGPLFTVEAAPFRVEPQLPMESMFTVEVGVRGSSLNSQGGYIRRFDNGEPAPTLGNNNDIYVDLDTFDIYQKYSTTWTLIGNLIGPTGATGAAGTNGTNGTNGSNGADGADGATWLGGAGVPDNGVGVNGDRYIRTSNGNVYLKAAGSWSVEMNIIGPQGIQGIQGIPGNDGADGADGADFTPGDTDGLTEGATNKYFTDERARDAVGAALVEGAGINITVDDAGDTITIASTITQYTDEMARDILGTALVAGTGISITPNDGADTITIASTSTVTQYTDEMARDALGTALTAGSGITITPNDGADTITIASSITQYTDEMARDALGTALVAGTGIGITVNDGSDTITIAQTMVGSPFVMVVAVSDETTALTTGTAKVTFRMPAKVTLTDLKASVTTAPTGGTLLTVDVNEAGASIISTKLTFDASSKTTVGAATPRVISDSSLAADAEMTIDIDAVGSTIAGAGLKVTLIGTYAA